MRPDGAVSPVRPRAESGFAATEGVHRSLNSYRRLGARSTDSPYEVVLTAAGRASFADLGYGSGREVGGGLWGHQNGNTLVVRFATQNKRGGYSGERTSRVRMSLASLAQHAYAYRDIADLLGTCERADVRRCDRAWRCSRFGNERYLRGCAARSRKLAAEELQGFCFDLA